MSGNRYRVLAKAGRDNGDDASFERSLIIKSDRQRGRLLYVKEAIIHHINGGFVSYSFFGRLSGDSTWKTPCIRWVSLN